MELVCLPAPVHGNMPVKATALRAKRECGLAFCNASFPILVHAVGHSVQMYKQLDVLILSLGVVILSLGVVILPFFVVITGCGNLIMI